ncbi:MAG: single-stranded DNA-binding protein [Clostridia bacterium]
MNKFEFLGRLTKEVETRVTTNGTIVATFDIAVNRRYNNEQVKADFFKITAFGKTGEFCSKYFQKGKQVLVDGRVQNRTWEDQNGAKRYATDYIAEQVYFADSNENTESQNNVDTGEFIAIDDTAELPF